MAMGTLKPSDTRRNPRYFRPTEEGPLPEPEPRAGRGSWPVMPVINAIRSLIIFYPANFMLFDSSKAKSLFRHKVKSLDADGSMTRKLTFF